MLSTRLSSLFLSASPRHDSKRARLFWFHRARLAATRSSSPKPPCRGRLTSSGPRRGLIPAQHELESIVSTLKASQRALLNADEQASWNGARDLATAVWGLENTALQRIQQVGRLKYCGVAIPLKANAMALPATSLLTCGNLPLPKINRHGSEVVQEKE
jgi:hypothetical protein